MLEVTDVEHGQDEFDVGVMAYAVCEAESARLALPALVARAEAAVEHAVVDGAAVSRIVQVALVRFKLGNGHGFLGREDRELDVFAEFAQERPSQRRLVSRREAIPCLFLGL